MCVDIWYVLCKKDQQGFNLKLYELGTDVGSDILHLNGRWVCCLLSRYRSVVSRKWTWLTLCEADVTWVFIQFNKYNDV